MIRAIFFAQLVVAKQCEKHHYPTAQKGRWQFATSH